MTDDVSEAVEAVVVIAADRGDHRQRLDLVLRRHLTGLSRATRTRVQQWIVEGRVTVDGAVVRRVASRVAADQRISVDLAGASALRREMTAEDRPVDVMFEDEYLLAINKPPGVVVHPTYAHGEGTMMNALLWRAREWPAGQRPSLVGRLDKLTSGLVLIAKTTAVHAALQRRLASPRSRKDYLAVVYGRLQPESGTIDAPLARDPRDRRRVIVSERGAPSRTMFERVGERLDAGESLSVVRCRLITGRMHQIRVHLASRGWPIAGDPKYGTPRWSQVTDAALSEQLRTLDRQALHAWKVAFVHPVTGAAVELTAPVPDDVKTLITSIVGRDLLTES